MRRIILLSILMSLFLSPTKAQKMQMYNGFVAGRPLQLVIHKAKDNRIEGYALDVNKKERYEIEGYYNAMGHYYRIKSLTPESNFRFLSMRASAKNANKLEGIYYGDQIRGFFDLQLQLKGNFNTDRTTSVVNSLYARVFQELGCKQQHQNQPFKQDLNTGLFYLDKGKGLYLPSGLLLDGREIYEFQNVRVKFRDWNLKTDDFQESLNLQFQVITYFPKLTVLVVVHEKSEELKGDSLITESFSFMLYEQKTDGSWQNITKEKAIGQDFLKRMQAKTAKADFEQGTNYFRVKTNGGGVLLNLNTPRTTLSIPDEDQTSKVVTLQWQWRDKGLIFN